MVCLLICAKGKDYIIHQLYIERCRLLAFRIKLRYLGFCVEVF